MAALRTGPSIIKRLGWFAWEWHVEMVDESGRVRATVGGHRRTFSACLRAVGGKGAKA